MIAVRVAHPGDAGAIAAIYAPHVLAGTATFEVDPPDADAMLTRMAASGGRHPWLVATVAGEIAGYACAAAFHSRAAYEATVETSVYVAEAAQRRGVGRRLYVALLDSLTAGGFAQAIGRIALPNPSSVGLHEALGFHAAGVLTGVGYKHGRWIDVGFWQRALAPGQPDQRPSAPR